MGKALRWTSIGLFTAVSGFLVWFGATYASVTQMLWFHAAAVPDAAHAQVLPLYLALMNLIGGSSAALGLLGAYVALGPLRQGVAWAGAALAITFFIPFVTAALTAEELAATTGAPTSWRIMGVLMALTAAAYAAHAAATRLPRALAQR